MQQQIVHLIGCVWTKDVKKKLEMQWTISCGARKASPFFISPKAELLQEGIFFLIQLFARAVLVMKKWDIKKTKPTFILSVLKVEY